MAGLTGKTISATYHSLLKVSTTDNANFVADTQKDIVDGEDTVSALKLATNRATITLGTTAGDDFAIHDGSSNILLVEGDTKFVTVGSGESTSGIKIDNTATDGDPFLAFALSGTQTFTMGIDDGDSDKFKIGTTAIGTNTRLTIDSSGNVGIGNAAPSAPLQIGSAGDVTIEKTYPNAIAIQGRSDGLLNNATIHFGDNVGGYGRQFTFANGLYGDGSGEPTSLAGNFFLLAGTAANQDPLGASGTGSVIMSFNQGGNVGIGADSPDSLLHLKSATSLEPILTLENTNADQHNPQIHFLKSDETSLADADYLGQIDWRAMNDASSTKEEIVFGRIQAVRDDYTDGTEDGSLHFYTVVNTTLTENLTIKGGNVGIGEPTPLATLHIKSGDGSAAAPHTDADELVVEGATNAGITISSGGTTNDGYLNFGDQGVGTIGQIAYSHESSHASDAMAFSVGGTSNVVVIKGSGKVGSGIADPLSPLHIYSSGETDIPILHVEHGEADMEAGDEILRLDASSDTDIHSTQLKIITIHDAGGEIGKFVTASDGNINTAWTNVSDVRLKKDIQDTSMDGLAIMNSIKLRDFKWNAESGKHRENKQVVGGLIADEIYEVYQQATTGTPGAVKEDGSIDRMGVTESQFITVMMKAIQELSAKVTALENT